MEKNRTSFPVKNPASSTMAKSRKFFDQWKQAASISKLGNRTKNLLGKWKSHSQSVCIVLSNSGGSGPATSRANTANNASGVRLIHDGLGGHHGVMGSDPGSTDGHAFAVDKPEPQKGKAQWSEHVWSILSKDVVGRLSGILNLKADGWLRKPAKTSKN